MPETSAINLWPYLILCTFFGACVGSFVNVVIHRLPMGMSLLKPGSHCPQCTTPIAWRDNIPVLSWLLLKGRCRHCAKPISSRYPIVEACGALLFGGYFYVCYFTGLKPEFSGNGLENTWPVLLAHLVLLGGMMAATGIDAKHYIIPLSVPWTVIVLGVALLLGASHWLPVVRESTATEEPAGWVIPVGGLAGLLISNLLLYLKILPRSFDESPSTIASCTNANAGDGEKQAAQAEGRGRGGQGVEGGGEGGQGGQGGEGGGGDIEQWLAHPHPRREVLKECLFLLPILLGLAAGVWVYNSPIINPKAEYGVWIAVLTAVALGFLIGGGLVWITRIGGTLAFGKEAMGLGDVHMLAAIGAILGPPDALCVFFIAPFMGLLYALTSMALSRLSQKQVRVIPYGPFLAAAAVVMMFFGRLILKPFGF